MKRGCKALIFCALTAGFVWCGSLLADRQILNEELIRLHVVADSDSREDQDRKLLVRDAVLESLKRDMAGLTDVQAARDYIQENLPKIRQVAVRALESVGCYDPVRVQLCKEAFDTRQYDTFSLPAGVYEALRITIGAGEGRNWWCVAFPSLCLPATSEGFAEAAAGAGFPQTLRDALTGQEEYQLRFRLLDLLGQWENSRLLKAQ